MQKTYWVESVLAVDEVQGLSVSVDMQQTHIQLDQVLAQIQREGCEVISITPITAGVGQYAFGPLQQKGINLTRLIKPIVGAYGYGFGYSYTQGFMILAKSALKKPKREAIHE